MGAIAHDAPDKLNNDEPYGKWRESEQSRARENLTRHTMREINMALREREREKEKDWTGTTICIKKKIIIIE